MRALCPRLGLVLGLWLSLFGLGACAAVLGIEDATLDAGDLCQQYCTTVEANCTGPLDVYESVQVCLDVCAVLQPGEPGAMNGNSANCRFTFAKAAAISEPQTNCPYAGPGGEGVCGDDCDSFCILYQSQCLTFFDEQHDNSQACIDDCEANIQNLPDGYNSGITTGDSLECRLYHVNAATQDPTNHCRHVAVEPGTPCDG